MFVKITCNLIYYILIFYMAYISLTVLRMNMEKIIQIAHEVAKFAFSTIMFT